MYGADLYGSLVCSLRRNVDVTVIWRLFALISVGLHWSTFPNAYDGKEICAVKWGDSLMRVAPLNILETVKKLVSEVLEPTEVCLSRCNFIP